MKTNNLLRLVQEYLAEGYFDVKIRDLIKNKSSYNDEEIDYMWDYVFKVQKKLIIKRGHQLTMGELKKEIGRLIGSKLSGDRYNASAPLTKPDVFKIYQYLTTLPEEYLKDRLDG